MTSIISPWAYASQLATQAQDRLTQAATIVRGQGPRPFEPTPDLNVGIPEHNGPDTPDNPWYIAPKPIAPPQLPNSAALRLAGGAVTAIDQALGLGAQLSNGVTLAFTRAKDEALAGVRMLETDPQLPIAPGSSALQFDAASMWLGLAKNLLTLDHGQPMPPVRPPVVHPPVTIQPVPGPGEPGSPITIKPITEEPITIQLPSPDSEIQ
jgi:hypothetical protein